MSFLEKIFGDLNEKEVKKLDKIADVIETYDEPMQQLSDEELRGMTQTFKDRLAEGESLDDILPEAFAVCREGAHRALGMKPFHVQLIGGIALHQGRIAEMKTGEGKTLVATLPAYLNALEGKGVHVVTVNDYLAKRDKEWMGKLYSFLGLSVGCIIHGLTNEERKEAYQCDITYGTNNEFGFDYLRDNMVIYKEDMSQRPLNYAIVDEVDSILVDEARTPLIISGQGEKSTEKYDQTNSFISRLRRDTDYTVDEKDRSISITDEGVGKIERYFDIENFADPDNMELNHHIMQALKAHNLMHRDIDYVVENGEIVIVDEFTGRLMYGRRYSDGLHQAIEAKERLKVRRESKTLATITIQNYFRMYKKLAGMTGTAKTEEDEFREIYNMDVVAIPTNKPVMRNDMPDSVYSTVAGKFKAIVDNIVEIHQTGQPILVGTISIENSEKISAMLSRRGVKHNVLNAKQHEKEAAIVADAGRYGAVTIATNMAGRGTDIILGGNPDFVAKADMRKAGYDEEVISYASSMIPLEDPKLLAARAEYKKLYDKYKEERREEQEKVLELGGLHILGTERHESRRIDNQLRGRSGRQGDPGSSQFYIALEDELMRLFGGERLQNMVQKLGLEEGEAIEAKMLSNSIENAQKKVEGRNFSIRKYVLQYDNVMNKQREIIYKERRRVLEGEDLREHLFGMLSDIVEEYVEMVTVGTKYAEEWDMAELQKHINKICFHAPAVQFDDLENMEPEDLKNGILEQFDEIYREKEAEIGEAQMRNLERMILLRVVDIKWMDHIDAMDQLKQGMGLRSVGHEDPVRAYEKEGFDMFELMIKSIKDDMVKYCFNVTIRTDSTRKQVLEEGQGVKEEFTDKELHTPVAGAQAMPEKKTAVQAPVRKGPKVGRNDPCPCGSGKKYKNCCGKNTDA